MGKTIYWKVIVPHHVYFQDGTMSWLRPGPQLPVHVFSKTRQPQRLNIVTTSKSPPFDYSRRTHEFAVKTYIMMGLNNLGGF